MTEYIWVNNWEKFQTYQRKRGKPWAPQWIRLYADLWDHDEFLDLPETTRLLLLGVFVAFSKSRGTLPKDTRSLSRRLHQRVTKLQLERLNDAGFIHFCSGTVREQLWNAFQNGSVLEEKRRDTDKDQEQEPEDQNPPTSDEASYEGPTPEMINNLIETTASGIKDIPW